MTRLAPVCLAVGAAAYSAYAYIPVGVSYYRVRSAARAFVHTRAPAVRPSPAEVNALVAQVRRDAGVELAATDVHLRREGGAIAGVKLRFEVPLQFPLLGAVRPLHFAVVATDAGQEE